MIRSSFRIKARKGKGSYTSRVQTLGMMVVKGLAEVESEQAVVTEGNEEHKQVEVTTMVVMEDEEEK
ncbi:hypothetical protein VNO80_15974 [Phaseolus coccineus]|uniref:Uncharacterized protein n=1 Tax=Phaseolus coccineus TaxID=3886 RepID=A0AAN9ML92_PHACN